MTKTLTEALNALDPAIDDHWTKDGSPSVDAIKGITGNNSHTRADIDAVLPNGFNRTNAHAAPTLGEGDGSGDGSDGESSGDAGAGDGAGGDDMDREAVDLMAAFEAGEDEPHMTDNDKAVANILKGCFDDHGFNAVVLMEAATAAAQADRFRRNNTLRSLTQGYQASQTQIKEMQARIDMRSAKRDERKPGLTRDAEKVAK